jgi:hypothetical protein
MQCNEDFRGLPFDQLPFILALMHPLNMLFKIIQPRPNLPLTPTRLGRIAPPRIPRLINPMHALLMPLQIVRRRESQAVSPTIGDATDIRLAVPIDVFSVLWVG